MSTDHEREPGGDVSLVPKGIVRLGRLYVAMGAAGLVCLVLLAAVDLASIYGFWTIALIVGAPAAGIGLHRQKPWARTLAMAVPVLSIPIWMVPGTIVYAMVEMVLNGMEGTHSNSPTTLLAYAVVTSIIMLPFWLLASVPQWKLLRRPDVREVYRPDHPGGRPVKVSILVLLISAVVLAYLPLPKRMLLHDASAHGWTGLVSILLHMGNSADRRTTDGRTPLHLAAQYGRTDTVRYLVGGGADVNAVAGDGSSPVYLAAAGLDPYYGGNYADPTSDASGTLVFLLRHGASPGRAMPVVLYEMHGYDARIVHAMLDAGAPINWRNGSEGQTFLGSAVSADDLAEVKYLLARGAKIEPDLIFAAGPNTLDFLLAKGLSINARNQYGTPLLHYYLDDNHLTMLKLVVSRGANLLARGEGGLAALHVCAKGCSTKAMKVLLDAGADPDVRETIGQTPLFYCIQYDSCWDCAGMLLKYGADINARDREGNTALHKAAGEGYPGATKFLIEHHANGRIKNQKGQTPYWAAKEGRSYGWAQVTIILRKSGFAD